MNRLASKIFGILDTTVEPLAGAAGVYSMENLSSVRERTNATLVSFKMYLF